MSQNINGVVTNYTYNELDQLLTTGSTQYQYDPRGNTSTSSVLRLIQITSATGTTQYGYNAQDRLTTVTLPYGTNIENTYKSHMKRDGSLCAT